MLNLRNDLRLIVTIIIFSGRCCSRCPGSGDAVPELEPDRISSGSLHPPASQEQSFLKAQSSD